MNEQDRAQEAVRSLKTPLHPVYYFESTHRKQWRLLYCLSRPELERRIRYRQTAENILADYPDGIDVDVSREAFDELLSSYKLQLQTPVWPILEAFGEICRRSGEYIGNGFIDAPRLERLAGRVYYELTQREIITAGEEASSEFPPHEERRETQAFNAKQAATIRETLARLRIRGVRAGRSLDKQEICRVALAGDVDSAAIFNALYTGQEADHGYRQ